MSEFSSKDPPTKPFKSATMRVSVNSKTLSRKNSSSKLEISNNITKDIDSLTLFIESLSAWLSEYYFSGTSLSLSHFPRVPILDYMQDIAPSLNQFRSILGIVRETTNTRISTLEAKMKQASSDKLIYSQTMGQIKTEIQKIKLKIEKRDEIILQIGLDKEKAEIESETKNKNIACFAQGFKKLKEEVEFLKDDIRIASSTVEYAIKEAQRWGYVQSKTKLETILDYTSEIKECVITLVKESHLKNQKIVDLELKLELETQKTHKNSGVQIEIINQLNKKMESINQSIDLKSQNSSHSIAIQNPRLEKYQILKDLLFNIILSLLSKAESLKRKTQFYAKNSRLYWKILNKYETDIKDILISKENLNKTPIKKFKISAWAVIFMTRIKINVKFKNRGIVINGMSIPINTASNFHIESLPEISYKSVQHYLKDYTKQLKFNDFSGLSVLTKMQSRDFSKFLYDVEEIIKLLLEENESFKSQYIKSQTEVNAFEVENKNLNDILTRTIEYAKGLERELLEIANDPNIIGNSEGLELELESHKKALKGLTSKYNQLERKMDLITNKNSLDTSYVRIDTESEDFSRSSYDV